MVGLPIVRIGVEIQARVEIWIEISAPPVLPSKLSYMYDGTYRTRSVIVIIDAKNVDPKNKKR